MTRNAVLLHSGDDPFTPGGLGVFSNDVECRLFIAVNRTGKTERLLESRSSGSCGRVRPLVATPLVCAAPQLVGETPKESLLADYALNSYHAI